MTAPRKKWNTKRDSVTRVRAAQKASSDAQVWGRLGHGARITLLACTADEIIGMSNRIANELEGWGLVVARAEGWELTTAGIRVRNHGKADNE